MIYTLCVVNDGIILENNDCQSELNLFIDIRT
jgi:hypothetical protein